MAVDRRTLAGSRALNQELAACCSNYLVQACLHAPGGDAERLARKRRVEPGATGHAERFMARWILLGMTPCGGQLPAARLGRTTVRVETLRLSTR